MFKCFRTTTFFWSVIMAMVVIQFSNASSTLASEASAHRITLADEGQVTEHKTTASTVGAFLNEQGIELSEKDRIIPPTSEYLDKVSEIQIDRAFYVNILINDEEDKIKVAPGKTAGELLSTLQNKMDAELVLTSDEEEELTKDAILEFNTWQSKKKTVVEPLHYVSEYKLTPSLSAGVEQVRQEGVMGERRREYEVTFLGNEEFAREVVNESIATPITRIVDLGTGGDLGTLTDTSLESFQYVQSLTMNASAYTAKSCCTGKEPNHPAYRITASGREVEHGIVAVDPSLIPLGTRLYVEGYGFALAADTGSAIKGHKIDLFMEDLGTAKKFGRRDVTVFILD